MKQNAIITLIAAMTLTACVGNQNDTATSTEAPLAEEPKTAEVVGIVGDGTSMHALELITLDGGDSLYFTYEVNSTDGIEIGDTVRVTYDYEQGDDAALSIVKL